MTQPPDPGRVFGDSVRLSFWLGDGGQGMPKLGVQRQLSDGPQTSERASRDGRNGPGRLR